MAYPDHQVRPAESGEQDDRYIDQYPGAASFFGPFLILLALLFGGVWIATTLRNDAPQVATENNIRDRSATPAIAPSGPAPSAPSTPDATPMPK